MPTAFVVAPVVALQSDRHTVLSSVVYESSYNTERLYYYLYVIVCSSILYSIKVLTLLNNNFTNVVLVKLGHCQRGESCISILSRLGLSNVWVLEVPPQESCARMRRAACMCSHGWRVKSGLTPNCEVHSKGTLGEELTERQPQEPLGGMYLKASSVTPFS